MGEIWKKRVKRRFNDFTCVAHNGECRNIKVNHRIPISGGFPKKSEKVAYTPTYFFKRWFKTKKKLL